MFIGECSDDTNESGCQSSASGGGVELVSFEEVGFEVYDAADEVVVVGGVGR